VITRAPQQEEASHQVASSDVCEIGVTIDGLLADAGRRCPARWQPPRTAALVFLRRSAVLPFRSAARSVCVVEQLGGRLRVRVRAFEGTSKCL